MSANPWIITIHLIALFIWLGHLLATSRALAFAAQQPEESRNKLVLWLRRSWNISSPFGLVVFVTGTMMLLGTGMPGAGHGETLKNYLAPRVADGGPSFWYITFHVKLVSALLLGFCDFWLGAQIFRLARGAEPKRVWPLATLLGIGGALIAHVLVWLSLSGLGVGPAGRYVGYGAAITAIASGIIIGRKLGRSDSKARYMAMHGLVAGLIVLIVILIIARPLSYGGSTL